jgi:hypothetical protein
VASLFGEVNKIRVHLLTPFKNQEKEILVYATELYLTEISELQVQIKQCYFKGHNYLIKAVFERKIIFFESPFAIPEDEIVYLTIDEGIIALH